jgi:hypothetical protein
MAFNFCEYQRVEWRTGILWVVRDLFHTIYFENGLANLVEFGKVSLGLDMYIQDIRLNKYHYNEELPNKINCIDTQIYLAFKRART